MEQPVQCPAWDVAQHEGLCILLCAFCVPSVFWRDSLVFEKFSKCTCWVECNTGTCNFAPLFFVAQVPNVAADASRVPEGCTRHVACVGDTILASDSEQGSWMPKVACRVYSTRASCTFACWCLTKQCSPCCPRSSAKNWTKWFCTLSCCPLYKFSRFSIHVSSFEVCQ